MTTPSWTVTYFADFTVDLKYLLITEILISNISLKVALQNWEGAAETFEPSNVIVKCHYKEDGILTCKFYYIFFECEIQLEKIC